MALTEKKRRTTELQRGTVFVSKITPRVLPAHSNHLRQPAHRYSKLNFCQASLVNKTSVHWVQRVAASIVCASVWKAHANTTERIVVRQQVRFMQTRVSFHLSSGSRHVSPFLISLSLCHIAVSSCSTTTDTETTEHPSQEKTQHA